MSKSVAQILVLSALLLLVTACSNPALDAYKKVLADRQAEYQAALERDKALKAQQEKNAVAMKEQEQQKAESLLEARIAEQRLLEEENESEGTPTEEPYGSNVASTPDFFVKLTPWEKTAIHWATAQEYLRLHSTRLTYTEAKILGKMHGTTADVILKNLNYWNMPSEAIREINRALPHKPKRFEKWREQFMEERSTPQNLVSVVATFNREQKLEYTETSLNRRGCEWIKGNYRVDSNPSSLCTPVRSGCVEGNCDNGYGTYVSTDGTNLVGEFEGGNLTKPYLPGTCVEGNCKNGLGTYAFSDGSTFVGNFKNRKPNGQGRKTWEIGITYIGEFRDGMAEGEGEYTMPAKHKRSDKRCVTGNCLDGQSVMMYPNDTKYVGQFKRGVPHGKGIYYWRDGEALVGEFENGELRAGGNYVYPDGHILIQSRKRGWHETYLEEDKSAREKYITEHRFQLLGRGTVEGLNRQYEAERHTKEKRCDGQHNRYSSQVWLDCGPYEKTETW